MDDVDAKGKLYDFSCVIKKMEHKVFEIQREFCEEIGNIEDIKKFSRTEWKTEGGNGVTQILEHDDGVFEKVCINASVTHGKLPTSAYFFFQNKLINEVSSPLAEKCNFFAAGLNGVVYPKNPNVPVLNFDYRYFETKYASEDVWWFGGSTDLVPSILDTADCEHFHEVLKTCCDKFDKSCYRTFKENCDKHYYLKHRGENRGIGGIYFENLNCASKDKCFQFVSACMNSIIPSYMPMVHKNKDKSFQNDDRQWQLLLRGRSVEYGFICNRPIEFALTIPGILCENILAFLPPLVKWQHGYTPDKNSKENKLLDVLRKPRDWV